MSLRGRGIRWSPCLVGAGGGRELVCVLFACKCPLGAGELDGLPVWLWGRGKEGAHNWSVCCLHVNLSTYSPLGVGKFGGVPGQDRLVTYSFQSIAQCILFTF